jgi:hypothetical protein
MAASSPSLSSSSRAAFSVGVGHDQPPRPVVGHGQGGSERFVRAVAGADQVAAKWDEKPVSTPEKFTRFGRARSDRANLAASASTPESISIGWRICACLTTMG